MKGSSQSGENGETSMANLTGYKSLNALAKHEGVERIYRDSDGIWVDLKRGWCNDPETHGYREDTVKEILGRKNEICRCKSACCQDEA